MSAIMIFDACILAAVYAVGLATGAILWGLPLRWLRRTHRGPTK